MVSRLGNVLYWLANTIAVACLLLGFGIAVSNAARDGWAALPVMAAVAVAVYLVGRAVRYVLAGR